MTAGRSVTEVIGIHESHWGHPTWNHPTRPPRLTHTHANTITGSPFLGYPPINTCPLTRTDTLSRKTCMSQSYPTLKHLADSLFLPCTEKMGGDPSDSLAEQDCVQQQRGKEWADALNPDRSSHICGCAPILGGVDSGRGEKFRKELRGVGGHKEEEGKGVQREICQVKILVAPLFCHVSLEREIGQRQAE